MRATRQGIYAIEAGAIAVTAVVLATFLGQHEAQIAAITAIFALAGIGLNILVGYTGLVSLGHVAFLAIGAYGWARLSTVSVPLALILPVILSLILAALIVGVTLRVSGYYFAITTLAIGLLSIVVVQNATAITRGFAGIAGIQQLGVPGFVGSSQVLVSSGVVLAVAYFLQSSLRESPLGTAMLATRFDLPASQSLGLSVPTVRLVAFMISSVPVTVAGSFLAQLVHYIGPDQVTLETSVKLIAIAIIGGRGWRWAPVLGAVVVITLPELLRPLAEYRLVFYGVALALVSLFMPRGLNQIAIWASDRFRILKGAVR
jgi:ABC-type branched-chain amino acid transport system, permease component